MASGRDHFWRGEAKNYEYGEQAKIKPLTTSQHQFRAERRRQAKLRDAEFFKSSLERLNSVVEKLQVQVSTIETERTRIANQSCQHGIDEPRTPARKRRRRRRNTHIRFISPDKTAINEQAGDAETLDAKVDIGNVIEAVKHILKPLQDSLISLSDRVQLVEDRMTKFTAIEESLAQDSHDHQLVQDVSALVEKLSTSMGQQVEIADKLTHSIQTVSGSQLALEQKVNQLQSMVEDLLDSEEESEEEDDDAKRIISDSSRTQGSSEPTCGKCGTPSTLIGRCEKCGGQLCKECALQGIGKKLYCYRC